MPAFNDRTGETRTMNNGLEATITIYHSSRDVDIMFENGAIVLNQQYWAFKNGMIRCPMLYETIGDYVKVTNPNTTYKTEFLIDADDLHIVEGKWWHITVYGYVNNSGMEFLHRLIMGVTDNAIEVDHKDGNKADCRKRNLRVCGRNENQQNVGKTSKNTSGYKGVSWDKKYGKWWARISVNKKYILVGFFDDKIEAAKAYNDAAVKYHGEFAKLNEI